MLANMNVSGSYFFFELLQIVLRKVIVHPNEMALSALAQPPHLEPCIWPEKDVCRRWSACPHRDPACSVQGSQSWGRHQRVRKLGSPQQPNPVSLGGENSREVFFVHLTHSAPLSWAALLSRHWARQGGECRMWAVSLPLGPSQPGREIRTQASEH